MVGRVMAQDISVTQSGLRVAESTGEVQLLETNLLAKSGLHLSQEPIIQGTVTGYIIAEEMVSEIY